MGYKAWLPPSLTSTTPGLFGQLPEAPAPAAYCMLGTGPYVYSQFH